mgnify:CR=1 FL=1
MGCNFQKKHTCDRLGVEQTTKDSEYLASARTAEVLDRLTRGAPGRMVVLDSPPALAASPAAELAKRRKAWKAPIPPAGSHRGYASLYFDTVLEADEGVDFDFLGSAGAKR